MTALGGWPKRFLYVGRYANGKGISVLLAAYNEYRKRIAGPWPLTCYGKTLSSSITEAPGVEDRGFAQPAEQPDIMAKHGAFVIASTYEPWGVAVAEACAPGLPVICTEACGASIDVVRSHYNGLTVATGDAEAMIRAMIWIHNAYDQLPELGRRSRELASSLSSEIWADRWWWMLRETLGGAP